jgi:uncharacterized membrane protein
MFEAIVKAIGANLMAGLHFVVDLCILQEVQCSKKLVPY